MDVHWSLQTYLGCSFGIYTPFAVCFYAIIASENEPTYFIQCVYIMFQCSYCVYWVKIFFLSSCWQFNTALVCYGHFNFLHCERPKTTDSLACTWGLVSRPHPAFWWWIRWQYFRILYVLKFQVKVRTAACACFSAFKTIYQMLQGMLWYMSDRDPYTPNPNLNLYLYAIIKATIRWKLVSHPRLHEILHPHATHH